MTEAAKSLGLSTDARDRWAKWLALACYALLTSVLVAHHEPWRDEADAWLIARDQSVLGVLNLASYSGTPCLWYFVQMPFAKLGLPFETQGILNLFIVLGAAALFLFRAPLPLVPKLVLLFGYHLSFEYSVIARNYGLGILLLFLVAANDRARFTRPLRYGVLLALLANVSAHFFMMSGVLCVAWLVELFRRERAPARFVGPAIAVLGIGATFAQLLPARDGQFAPGLFTTFVPVRLLAPYRTLFPYGESFWLALVSIATFALPLLYLATRPRALLLFLGSYACLLYIFVFKHGGGTWHYGLVLILLIASLWIGEQTPENLANPLARTLRIDRARLPVVRRSAYAVLSAGVFVSWISVGAPSWMLEMNHEFSEARSMALYLKAERLENRRIAAHMVVAESLLPYLPGKSFYYPSLGKYGTHLDWDRRYYENYTMPVLDAVAATKRRFSDWRNPADPVLLLLNQPLPEPARNGYRLVHRTPGKPWRADETFYLYEPAPEG